MEAGKSQDDVSTKPPATISPAARIKELQEIDTSISQLVRSAGDALQVLGLSSSSPAPANDAAAVDSAPTSLVTSKSQFLSSMTTYFQLLSSIDVRLRRQVYALEEAGLVAKGDIRDAKRGASASASALMAGSGVGAGAGAGSAGTTNGPTLDVGWLNGGGEQVERDMEREVWRRAREFMEKFDGMSLSAEGEGEAGDAAADEDGDESMMDAKEDT